MNTQGQIKGWQALAEAVREELRECAWLLSLLDKQQKAILARDTRLLRELDYSIREQSSQVQHVRDARVSIMLNAGGTQCLLPDSTLNDLSEQMPPVLQPLFQALACEAVSLRKRLRRRTIQNRRILERASLNVSSMFDIVRPGSVTRTYGRKGGYHISTSLKGAVVHTAV